MHRLASCTHFEYKVACTVGTQTTTGPGGPAASGAAHMFRTGAGGGGGGAHSEGRFYSKNIFL